MKVLALTFTVQIFASGTTLLANLLLLRGSESREYAGISLVFLILNIGLPLASQFSVQELFRGAISMKTVLIAAACVATLATAASAYGVVVGYIEPIHLLAVFVVAFAYCLFHALRRVALCSGEVARVARAEIVKLGCTVIFFSVVSGPFHVWHFMLWLGISYVVPIFWLLPPPARSKAVVSGDVRNSMGVAFSEFAQQGASSSVILAAPIFVDATTFALIRGYEIFLSAVILPAQALDGYYLRRAAQRGPARRVSVADLVVAIAIISSPIFVLSILFKLRPFGLSPDMILPQEMRGIEGIFWLTMLAGALLALNAPLRWEIFARLPARLILHASLLAGVIAFVALVAGLEVFSAGGALLSARLVFEFVLFICFSLLLGIANGAKTA